MLVRFPLTLTALLLLWGGPAALATEGSRAPEPTPSAQEAPGPGWTLVRLSEDTPEAQARPCWRRMERDGYTWLPGQMGPDGQWYQGHWRPNAERPGQIWVPGHPGSDGRWVLGFWRAAARDGFIWIDGYWIGGLWHQGHWSPVTERPGYVWVQGHVQGDSWRIGYWRPAHRAGSIWVPAHWRYGVWTAGFWHIGVWAWAPYHQVVVYAEPEAGLKKLNRETLKTLVRPRYVALALGQGADREGAAERRERERGSAERESRREERREERRQARREREERKAERERKRARRERALPRRPSRFAPRPIPRRQMPRGPRRAR